MKAFGYTLEEFKEIDIPTYRIMFDELNKETERKNKENKPKGRR